MKDLFTKIFTRENIYIGLGVIAGILLLFLLLLFIQWKRTAKRKLHPKVDDHTLAAAEAVKFAKANIKTGLVRSFRAEFGDLIPADRKALLQYVTSFFTQRSGSPYVPVENLVPFLRNVPGVFLQGRDTVGGAYVLPVVSSEGDESNFRLEGLIISYRRGEFRYSETCHIRIHAQKVGQSIEEVLTFEL